VALAHAARSVVFVRSGWRSGGNDNEKPLTDCVAKKKKTKKKKQKKQPTSQAYERKSSEYPPQ
jgi:hypothetical protein